VSLPPHPWWFWLILCSPIVTWLGLWLLFQRTHLSLKPFSPWLKAVFFLSFPAYLLLEAIGGHRILRVGIEAIFYTCMALQIWIDRLYMLETMGDPRSKWHFPWNSARFSIPRNARIRVRDLDSTSSWYAEKLGLEKAVENPWADADTSTYKFKEGGRCITLTTRDVRTDRNLILFTKKLHKMQRVLFTRGISAGLVKQDRQGTRYFEIRDPEGNTIEVIEEM